MDKSYDEPNIGDKNKKKRTGEKKARTKKSGKEVVVELQPQSEPDVVCLDDDTIPSYISLSLFLLQHPIECFRLQTKRK